LEFWRALGDALTTSLTEPMVFVNPIKTRTVDGNQQQCMQPFGMFIYVDFGDPVGPTENDLGRAPTAIPRDYP
jgi:hypothetical protein